MFEANPYAGGHTNTVRVDTERRDPRRRHRLHRLQRPQLPELRAAPAARRGGVAAVRHELRGERRARRLRVRQHVRQRAVRQARAPRGSRGSIACSPTSCASSAPRASCCARATRGRRSGTGSRSCGFSRPFIDRADRAPGLGRVVGGPAADVDVPGALPGRVLPQPRHARAARPAASGARSRAARRATSRRSRSRGATASGCRTPVQAIERARGPRDWSRRAAERPSASTRSCSPRTPTRRSRMLADPSDREHELLGAIPYQPNEAVLHTDRALLPRRRRAWASWNYHLLAEPPGKTTVTYHMNRLQSLARGPRVLRHAQPHARRSTRTRSSARSTTRTRSTPRRRTAAQARHDEISGAHTARTTAARTGAGASTRTAS